MPSLKDRPEDLDPNIDYELQHFTHQAGHKISFNKSARSRYLAFAHSEQASWRANFRDLNSSITRMATLADGGRITEDILDDEISRLRYDWSGYEADTSNQTPALSVLKEVLSDETIAEIDLFDQTQLAQVIEVCRQSKTMAEAGRKLFNVSRTRRTTSNDSHRLKVYLQKFGLEFRALN